MKNVVAKTFRSPLTTREILAVLQRSKTGMTWGLHDSELNGYHLTAHPPDGTAIDIYCEDWSFSAEVYFPTEKEITDADKQAFLQRLNTEVLPAIQAENVTSEWE